MSEVASALDQTVYSAWLGLWWPEQFWVLGKSYEKVNIHSNDGLRCDENSCYDRCLSENKICKQATRNTRKDLFDVDSNILITTIVAGVIIFYTLCDMALFKFLNNFSENDLLFTSGRKSRSLMLSVILYLAAAIPLFLHRFEVIMFFMNSTFLKVI